MEAERDERDRVWSREDGLLVCLLLLLTLGTWWPRLRGSIDLRFDAGVYYTLGTSLAEGRGYRLLYEPGTIEAVQYPPLLPALVAAHQLVLGSSDPLVVGPALRATYLAFSLVFALTSFALARRFLPRRHAFAAALLSVLYFHAVYLEDLLFAELPFALALLGFLLAAGARGRARAWAAPLAAATFFLRSAGLAVLAGWSLEALLRRDWRALGARSVLALACVGAWQGYVHSVTSSSAYREQVYPYQRAPYQYYNVTYAENVALLDPFRPEAGPLRVPDLATRVLANAPTLLVGLGETVSVPRGYWEWPLRMLARALGRYVPLKLALVPLLLLASATLFGLVLVGRREPLLVVVLGCSLLLIAVTPWPAQFLRYMMPFAPLACVALLAALGHFARWRSGVVPVAVAGIVAVQLFCLRQTYVHFQHELVLPGPPDSARVAHHFLFEERRRWQAFYDGLEWLRVHAPSEARVVTSCPQLAWLYTGRQAVMPPLEADVARAGELLDAVPADYLVVDELAFVDMSRRYALPVVTAHPERWQPVFRQEGLLAIYARVR